MFEHLIDENDLEVTEHQLRVEAMLLKQKGDVVAKFRLYCTLAHVLVRRGNMSEAIDCLNEAEQTIVEARWRGTTNHAWFLIEKGHIFRIWGRPEVALKDLAIVEEILEKEPSEELQKAVDKVKAEWGVPAHS